MRRHSIRVWLSGSIAALLLIFVIVSASAIFSLVKIDRQIATIDRKWLTGTQMLSDLKNTVAEFHVAEAYRSLAVDRPTVIQAEFLAERQAKIVGSTIERIESVAKTADMEDDFQRFRTAWRELWKAHQAWIGEAAGEKITPIGYGTMLQKRYEAVLLAATNLMDDASAAATAEVGEANASATRITTLLIALSAAAATLAVGVMAHVELHISRPLGAITSALTRLAAGDRDVRLPVLPLRDEISAMANAFEVFRRNAVALRDAQERAEALAQHDALTGLANRRLFSQELETALGEGHGGAISIVMLIDLDRFKPVNDAYGHAVGDLVLCEIGRRLRLLAGAATAVARLGGDEFAVILPTGSDRDTAMEQASALARRVVSRLAEPITLDQAEITVGASVGIAMVPIDGSTAEDVLRSADLAMYRAKRERSGTFCFFQASMQAELRKRADLETELRAAIEADQIQPYYQPMIDLATGRMAGVEVLARWKHPVRGFVPPDVFIPMVDQLGALGRLTETILRQAIRCAGAWEPHLTLAVNISPRQLQDSAFPTFIAAVLLSSGFTPERLEIEVTETALVENIAAAKASIEALRELGVRVVLDDFGTGYSSLSHIREFAFDQIKIDKSFIATITHNAESAHIVDAILGLARNLGKTVVAEGIETAEVADLLVKGGCTFGQGYLYSPAVPAEVIARMAQEPARLLKAG